MHLATIYVKDYFSSKKKINKLAREVNFYSRENAKLKLCFEDVNVKHSDLIYFFKKLKISYENFKNIVSLDQIDDIMIYDIAYAILKKRRYFTVFNSSIGLSVMAIIFLIYLFSNYIVSNFSFFKHVYEVRNKIYYLIDKYQAYKSLVRYYGSDSIQSKNQKRSLEETINSYSYNLVKNCDKFNIKYDLKLAIDWNESGFQKFSKSNIEVKDKKGEIVRVDHAYGWSQVYLYVWKDDISIALDDEEAICDDYNNTYWGCFILRFFINSSKNNDGNDDIYKALVRYNGGRKENKGDRTIINTETFEHIRKIYNDRDSISDITCYQHKKGI